MDIHKSYEYQSEIFHYYYYYYYYYFSNILFNVYYNSIVSNFI
ncbi:MAG: hypothetical protein K7J15_06025 [Candidatus Regiella insecticola]|nr:hypothetical protein [Candidatus Regiella insecticola]